MNILLRQIPIPFPTSPLKGEEHKDVPPLQGEGKGGGGVPSKSSSKGTSGLMFQK